MIEAVIDVQDNVTKTIQGLLRELLEKGVVDAWLVPMALPGGSVAPSLVSDPAALERADPLAPVLPINAARAVSQLTLTAHKEKLGVVLRACEIRALVELTKFQQASLDNVLVVGLDCLGTYAVDAWRATAHRGPAAEALLAAAGSGELQPYEGLQFRAACQMCEQPLPADPAGGHVALSLGLVGVEPGKLYVQARPDLAEALALVAGGAPAGRKAAVERLVEARTRARDAALAGFRSGCRPWTGCWPSFRRACAATTAW